MSTEAAIKFRDEFGREILVRRGHDGYPAAVVPDLEQLIRGIGHGILARWSGSEIGQTVALFFALNCDPKDRIQEYTATTELDGDEEYIYHLEYVKKERKWTYRVQQVLE